MPRSPRRLLDPQDHGSLEDIALHLELGDPFPQPHQLGLIVSVEPLRLPAFDLVLRDPVTQRPRVHPQFAGDLREEPYAHGAGITARPPIKAWANRPTPSSATRSIFLHPTGSTPIIT